MGVLKKIVRSVTPAHVVAAVLSPVGAIAAGAKLLAPKSSVTDIIATGSPTAIPLIKNEKIKMAAIGGYSVAAIAAGGIAAAHAYGVAGGVAGSAGSSAAAKAALQNESVAGYLAGSDDYGPSGVLGEPDLDTGYTPDDAEPGESSGFKVADLLKGGSALLGLTGKKKVTGGAAAVTGPEVSFASMLSSPINILLFLTGGAVLYFFYKKAVR